MIVRTPLEELGEAMFRKPTSCSAQLIERELQLLLHPGRVQAPAEMICVRAGEREQPKLILGEC